MEVVGGLTYSLPALFVAYSISSNLPHSTFKTNQTTTQETDAFWVTFWHVKYLNSNNFI